MSASIAPQRMTQRDSIVAFKFAPNGESEFRSSERSPIGGWYDRGEVLKYEVGTRVVSPSGPGIMVYRELPLYGEGPFSAPYAGWFVVVVPKDAEVYLGYANGNREILCASEVFVKAKIGNW